ncbi:uncharacterized protein LOC133172453 [Saccostrea echinata]|uniref:uncharacterized protein LOC133172453 n=1 Tax=Saccostrea echinata TaxID=191078 RepID=UPI002A80FBBF|nr:uncharacterized protein LOC133172453 [Saccostrea echinata]
MCLGKEFKRNFTFTHKPSCSPCECNDSCVRRDTCCPSKFYRQKTAPDFIEYSPIVEDKERGPPMSCLEPLWNTESGIRSWQSYWMIQTCPNGTSCMPSTLRNMTNITPVTSLLTNETYSNVHCAFCNNEQIFDLVLWDKKKICTSRSNLMTIDDPETLFQSVFAINPACNIGFYPLKSTQKIVSSCVTRTYDPIFIRETLTNGSFLNLACQKYYLPYTANDKVFKNIYCALLENEALDLNIQYRKSGSFGGIDSMLITFSALMDFKQNKKEGITKNSKCKPDQIFDEKMSKCLEIKCEAEYFRHNSECKSLYPMLEENNYELNLKVTPLDDYDVVEMQFYTPLVRQALQDILSHRNMTKYLCRISALIPSSTDEMFLAIVLELSINHFHNVDLMIENLVNMFSKLNMTLNSELMVSPFRGLISVLGQSFHIYGGSLFGRAIKYRYYFNPMNGHEMHLYDSINMLNDNRYDPTRPHCLKDQMMVVAADWYRCPKVRIRTTDAKLDVSNFSVCLTEYQSCFSSRYFKESLDKRGVEICLTQYFNASTQPISLLATSEDRLMKYFSLFCLSLSSLASIVTICTFVFNNTHRTIADINIIILAGLSVLANTTYTFSKFFLWSKSLCIGIGILVHFFWLSVICWMSLSTFQIFQTFTSFSNSQVKVRSRVLACFLVDIFICSFIITINVIVSYMESEGESLGYSPRTCYIGNPNMVLFTFALPVGLFVCINTFMFVVTVSRIRGKVDIRKSKEQGKIGAYFRLSTITGAAWLFGFLAQFTEFQLFSMLHTLLNGGQGVFVYIAFGLSLNLKCRFGKSSQVTEKITESVSKNKPI